MHTEHSPGPVTAFGHANYRPYDASAGKCPHRCPCGRGFATAADLKRHQHEVHTGETE